MEFDIKRVYTAVNADELKVGSKVYVSDILSELKEFVINDKPFITTLKEIQDESHVSRFRVDTFDMCLSTQFTLAYLVSEPEVFYVHLQDEHYYTDKKYTSDYMFTGTEKECYEYVERNMKSLKWTDLKIGDIIRGKEEACTVTRMVTGIDTAENHDHIEIGGYWLRDNDLKFWEKVE